jgi:hypothetical protein
MTDDGRRPINEELLLWLELFKRTEALGKCLFILDGHASHSNNIRVLDFDD